MPEFINIPSAMIDLWENNITQTNINKHAKKFRDADWNLTYLQLIEKYIELKNQNNWYLPWVWFCRNIAHAEFIKQEMEKKWIRVIRVTSANKEYDWWVDETKAKAMLEKNETDFVITVSKVSEWWDIPTLRCAIPFTPILSEAKYLQWIWRTLRLFEFKESMKQYWIIPKTKTIVIEPEFWNIHNKYKWELDDSEDEDMENNDQDEKWETEESNDDKNWNTNTKKISWISHLYNSWEFDLWFLEWNYGDISNHNKYKLENDWTIKINWIIYTAVNFGLNENNSKLSCNWEIALNRISKQDEQWKKKNELTNKWLWKRWTRVINLYNLKKLLKILPIKWKKYELLQNRTVNINWTIYTAVTHAMNQNNSLLTCSWYNAIIIIHEQNNDWKDKNILKNSWFIKTRYLDLYNLEELLKILPEKIKKYKLLSDWTVFINWITYISINKKMNQKNSKLPCSSKQVLQKINKLSEYWKKKNILIKAWKNWPHFVDLYNYVELIKILPIKKDIYEVWDDWTVEINWILYTIVTFAMNHNNSILPCSWKITLKLIEEQDSKWKKNNILINTWRKKWKIVKKIYNLVELLKILPKKTKKYSLSNDGTVIIDWIIYTTVINSMNQNNSMLTCNWWFAIKIINNQTEKWIKTNVIKNSWISRTVYLDLYNLEELLKILPKK